MDLTSAPRGDALEAIAYLSRSENRVRILDELASGSLPRRELETETGVSRTTLGRILGEFEEREWAERTADGEYAATPRGRHVITAFRPVVEEVAAIQHLGESVAQLPTEELSIGLEHFEDAVVRRPEPNDPLGLVRRLVTLLEEASSFRSFTFLAPPVPVGEAMADGVESGQLTAEHVLAGGLVEYIQSNPDGPPPWQAYLEAGARVYRYDDHIPCNMFVIDDTVIVLNDKATGNEFLESDDGTVREWAVELIGAYREDAERVAADSFA